MLSSPFPCFLSYLRVHGWHDNAVHQVIITLLWVDVHHAQHLLDSLGLPRSLEGEEEDHALDRVDHLVLGRIQPVILLAVSARCAWLVRVFIGPC